MSMETQYLEEGGTRKLFRKPTKTLQKSPRRDYLSRNTLGNRRRDPATRSKSPTQRRINGVKQEENLSETRTIPNIRRAPTKAGIRKRTKLRARNENSFSGQLQVRNQIG